MKRLITSLAMASTLAVVIPFSAATAEAQTRSCTCRTVSHRTVSRRASTARSSRTAYANAYNEVKRPNIYERHRRLFNTGIGAGVGALVGGLIGGRRGAGWGLLAGGGGSQIFTHYQKPKNYTRYRRP